MRSAIPTATALVAALFFGDVLAGPHQRHQQFHNKKRDEVVVTEDYLTTVTVTDIVTVEWPPAPSTSAPPPAAATPTTTAAATSKEVVKPAVLLEKPSSSPTPSSVAPVVAAAKPASSSAAKAASPILNVAVSVPSVAAVIPTTLATQVKPTPAASPKTTTTPQAPPASSTPSSSSGSGSSSGGMERGVPFNTESLLSAFVGSGSQIKWCYDWGQTGSSFQGMTYYPMLWSPIPTFTDGWMANAQKAIDAGSDAILYCNEPDLNTQANISPEVAAAGWKQWMEPFKGKAKLGACAPTNGGAPMGTAWTEAFFTACAGECSVDFCPYHFYDSATNIDYFKSYVAQAYAACGNRHIWFTEIGLTGSNAQISAWMEEVLPWLEGLGYVDKVAYFMANDGNLLSGTALSAIGQTWTDFTG